MAKQSVVKRTQHDTKKAPDHSTLIDQSELPSRRSWSAPLLLLISQGCGSQQGPAGEQQEAAEWRDGADPFWAAQCQ